MDATAGPTQREVDRDKLGGTVALLDENTVTLLLESGNTLYEVVMRRGTYCWTIERWMHSGPPLGENGNAGSEYAV